MSIYLSTAYVLSSSATLEAYLPRICFHNLATVSTISTDQEDGDFPATNLANPATNLLWKSGSTAAQNITVLFSYNDDVDYIAIARHNFGSGGCSVIVEGLDPGGDPDDDGDWTELVAEQLLGDDTPAVFIFDGATVDGLRLVLAPDTVEPQCAVVMCGKSTVLPYGVPLNHAIISYARSADAVSSLSQGGDHLGTVETTAWLSSSIELRNLDKTWYLANLKDMALLGKRATFFFAHNPQSYPTEVGYCWTTNDPIPHGGSVPGWIDITFEIGGIAI